MFDIDTIRTNASELLDLWQEASDGRIAPYAAVEMLRRFSLDHFKFDMDDAEAYRAAFPHLSPSQLQSEAAVSQALVENVWASVVPEFAAKQEVSMSGYRTQLEEVARDFGEKVDERFFATNNHGRQPITLGEFVDFLRGDGRAIRKEIGTLIDTIAALPDEADLDDFQSLASRLKFACAAMPDVSSMADGVHGSILALIDSNKNRLLGMARFAEFARDGIVQFNAAAQQKKAQSAAYRA
ncbi:hypothetical protein [Rhizobium sp. BK176]|uniref:hypothetical protein n=1 Tax=Rhizobium sp. BK176 TaxID=2587071 RepID=UPI002166DB60|nr:hypothetical protein [Rhizobium sp. BK176]MCS4089114.1 hypothetical protein [Rhizobium sp. BK176]